MNNVIWRTDLHPSNATIGFGCTYTFHELSYELGTKSNIGKVIYINYPISNDKLISRNYETIPIGPKWLIYTLCKYNAESADTYTFYSKEEAQDQAYELKSQNITFDEQEKRYLVAGNDLIFTVGDILAYIYEFYNLKNNNNIIRNINMGTLRDFNGLEFTRYKDEIPIYELKLNHITQNFDYCLY